MKVNITVNDELLKRIDEYAEKNFMSRSGLFCLGMTQFLNGQLVIDAIQDMSVCMRKIADTNEVDADTQKRLQEFKVVADMFVNNRL